MRSKHKHPNKEKLCTFLEGIEDEKYADDEEEGMEESAFSRQHYQAIADILSQHVESDSSEAVSAIAGDIADLFETDNPNFDRDKFMDAAGVKNEDCGGGEEEKQEVDGVPVEEGDEEPDGEPEVPADDEEEPEDDLEEGTAQLNTIDKVLKSLGSDPLSGVEDLLTLVSQSISKVASKLSGSDKKKVESVLDRMKREALERGNPLAKEEKDDEEDLTDEE